jgi:protein-tyrosine phosphatase
VDILDEQFVEYFEIEMFVEVIKWLKQREKVFVHCDYGQSRSPSFCMVYGSKILKVLPTDFLDCVRVVKSIQPDYVSPSGISKFLKKNWKSIDLLFDFDQNPKTFHH